ncbi:aldo/keto reductase [Microbispora sp. H10836]|uniref:aldo/keto reductase n=1 Tax=Microbispora sp. H10836 TaxID=2729106 RepID=UPI00147449AD|nr:aldo/keto reductase [Microbispora sp. H10836]
MNVITLNNNVRMPQLGFGVWQVADDEAEKAVTTALECGYRSIDTAKLYRNEKGVGLALRASGIPREELFVTTKLWNDDHGYDKAMRAFDAGMRRLGLETLDLYLIHWPAPRQGKYVETWKALEMLYVDKRVAAIGVSNFTVANLEHLLAETEVIPALNQIELHPQLAQRELRGFHAHRGIATEAWSPLGQGKGLLDLPVLAGIGAKYGKTAAQVVLRWHIQLGNIVIPKSVTPSRIKENIEVFDFALSPEDMAAINGLDEGRRLGPDPVVFG